jgi:hypothetical protein
VLLVLHMTACGWLVAGVLLVLTPRLVAAVWVCCSGWRGEGTYASSSIGYSDGSIRGYEGRPVGQMLAALLSRVRCAAAAVQWSRAWCTCESKQEGRNGCRMRAHASG